MSSDPLDTGISITAVNAGDIVLVYDQSTRLRNIAKRWGNVVGQRILAAIRRGEHVPLKSRLPYYSHVLLGLGGGLIIHADGKTVAVEVIHEALHFHAK